VTTRLAVRTYAFETLDVFTGERFGGNQLAVFTDARGLADHEMQALAKEMNLSETAFVLPPDDPAHTARVRIFHRTAEMPFAGHPTLGTAVLLARTAPTTTGTLVLEVNAGLVPVTIERDDDGLAIGGVIGAPQPLSVGETLPAEVIAACAGLHVADIIMTRHAPCVAAVGTAFVIAEVRAEALATASPNLNAFTQAVVARPHFGNRLSLYLYVRDGLRVRARMFAPLAGTWEDPATGSANAAFAALQLSLVPDEQVTLQVVQGAEMGRRSELIAAARRDGDAIRATVGGRCVRMFSGSVTF
jgi:trans-2,3-dihydro-3-hydroxyanthranilate isomerase